VRVTTLCGSLGAASANTAALSVAADYLHDQGRADTSAFEGLHDVPPFRADQVDDPPAAVRRLQADLEQSDGLLVGAPEYAGGLAGLAKNALDWLVGSASLYHMPVGVLSAGTTGGEYAIEQMVRTLSWQGALVVAVLGIEAPVTKMDEAGSFVDVGTVEAIHAWAAQVVAAFADDAAGRLVRVSDIVTPYGIDPARFGDLT